MGENLQDLKPREATCPSKSSNAGRSWKPFTRLKFMAKWEIRFQRFAISFRPSALGLCRFRLPLAFSLQPLAFASGANEKFHLSPDINVTASLRRNQNREKCC
jgi:hypothetical protein